MQPNLKWLVLVPTLFELKQLRFPPRSDVRAEVCGFGVIAAAARAAQLMCELRPHRVLVVGIAGTYLNRLPIGEARQFLNVSGFGIGIGSGSDFETAANAGWSPWPGPPPIGEKIQLASGIDPPDRTANSLVTVCAAAGTRSDADRVLSFYPDGVAEEMEGYGVAFAGALLNIPVTIVRGISNNAGDRDPRNWQIPAALAAANVLAAETLESY